MGFHQLQGKRGKEKLGGKGGGDGRKERQDEVGEKVKRAKKIERFKDLFQSCSEK